MLTETPPPGRRDDGAARQVEPRGDANGLIAVGVRAPFWIRDTGSEPETVLDFAGDWIAEDMARYASTSHVDDGCVDFWPEVGGQTEVRTLDGTVIAVYRDGRRFGPEVGRP